MKELKHANIWNSAVNITERIVTEECEKNCSQLTSLNLAHNSFDSVPPMLACIAVNLLKLNMSYNRYHLCFKDVNFFLSKFFTIIIITN